MQSSPPPEYGSLYEEIGAKIREKRETLNITQDDMAKKCKMSRLSYHQLENGQKKVPLHYYYLIANAIGLNIQDIVLPQMEAITLLEPEGDKIDSITKEVFSEQKINKIMKQIQKQEK